jgi:hypothetical protein
VVAFDLTVVGGGGGASQQMVGGRCQCSACVCYAGQAEQLSQGTAPVRRPKRPSPEAARRPKPRSSLGRPRPVTRRSPRVRHAPMCHPRHAGRTRTHQSGGPSVTRHPRAPYYSQDITPSSPLVGLPLFKCPPFLLAPPDPTPAAPPRPPWPPPGKLPPCSPLDHRACE